MAAAEFQFHVLAVDDSLIDRKLIERLLKISSCQVTSVDSGSKALEFLGLNQDDSSNPDSLPVSPDNNQEIEVNLIITDYCMPGMTGYDLLKKVKESSSLRDIPVVIMSSENNPSRINRCLEEGAEEFLLKPVRLSDVNKLRPHMMKTKCKNDQKLGTPEIQEPSIQASLLKEKIEHRELEQQHSQPQLQTLADSRKRKPVDQGLSPDNTRPKLNGLPVFSSV